MKRRALAPVEFVLWLPILLFVAGLMVVFGTMAGWRIRGEVISRDAAWRTRWPRTGLTESPPNPKIWPADALMTVEPAGDIHELNDPAVMHPIAVGPLPGGFEVRPRLHFKNGSYAGIAEIEREYPLMSRLGRFESGKISHPILDMMNVVADGGGSTELNRRINFQEARTWGHQNIFRRSLLLYEFPSTDQSLPQAFGRAALTMVSAPKFKDLSPLDQDEDFKRYRGYSPDFHPYIPHPYRSFADGSRRVNLDLALTDREQVYKDYVVPLLDGRNEKNQVLLGQISYLPRTMTQQFLSLYESRIRELEQMIRDLQIEQQQLRELLREPGISQAQRVQYQRRIAEIDAIIAAAKQEIAPLKVKIDQLEEFQARLPAIERRLVQKAIKYAEDSGIDLPLKD